jgi:general secretion pathway protein G
MRAKRGFTLVEILIVVVILGILAAIVIPQFTEASTEAKLSSLCSDLQTVRSQIELYKVQHNDAVPLPEVGGATWNRMTQYTDIAGNIQATKDATFCYGPYLQKVPTNQFNDKAVVEIGAAAADTGTVPSAANGWFLNGVTGVFKAVDSAAHAAL